MGTGDWNDGLDAIGRQGRGESVWLGFFLYYILQRLRPSSAAAREPGGKPSISSAVQRLQRALEDTWRGDRYLRAIHDDGTEIGLAGSGVWEIDALTAAWAVMSGINPRRGRTKSSRRPSACWNATTTILLGWPPLREDTTPYLGRSSRYPEGVRENGMYCHGVQWLVGAARILAENCRRDGDLHAAGQYAETAWRYGGKRRRSAVTPGTDRNLRRPTQPAAGRHDHQFRPGPHDLERLHGRRRLDVSPGLGRRAWRGLQNNRLVGPSEFAAPVAELGMGAHRPRSVSQPFGQLKRPAVNYSPLPWRERGWG